jgi:hypothetical protein
MSRPPEPEIDANEWVETGRCGCLIPDDEVTEGDCAEGDDDE